MERGLGGTLTLVTDPKEARAWVKAAGERSPVLAEVELHVFRGATLYVVSDGDRPMTYNVTRFGKRRKNVWEPYANWYTAYTVTEFRRRGHAKRLAEMVKAQAAAFGCRRLKALAGTRLGLLLHVSLGDELWGVTPNNEVAVDTPLVECADWAGRPPPNAVLGSGTRPWTVAEVDTALRGAEMRYDAMCKKK